MRDERAAYVGRPVKLRRQGNTHVDSGVVAALTVPAWLMARSDFKIGDKFVPQLEGDNIVFIRENADGH